MAPSRGPCPGGALLSLARYPPTRQWAPPAMATASRVPSAIAILRSVFIPRPFSLGPQTGDVRVSIRGHPVGGQPAHHGTAIAVGGANRQKAYFERTSVRDMMPIDAHR